MQKADTRLLKHDIGLKKMALQQVEKRRGNIL